MRSSAAVALGGAVGAGVRWLVADLLAGDPGDFPWATLYVNMLGCLLIGVAAARLARGSVSWDGLVVGALGGFTTFSAFSVETRQLVDADRSGAAVAYVVLSVVAGLAAVDVARHLAKQR